MIELNGKKILITFLMHLGDVVLTTPFIHALRKAAPDSHITYLVDEKLKDVVLHNPNIDEVITIDKLGRDNSFLSLLACARRLSKLDFDVVINLHPNERCSFICSATKTKWRVGTAHTVLRPFWDIYVQLDRTIHAADMYLDVLHELGVKELQHNGLEMFVPEETEQTVNRFWLEKGVQATEKLIGFNIGSDVSTKRWAPERFAQVADAMIEKGYKHVFFGDEGDETFVQEAISNMKYTPIIATGAFSIGELAVALRRCDLLITNDSGPMYVAISQDVPVVALYGPSSTKLYGPYTPNAIAVTAQPPCLGCAGSMKHKCDDMQCMNRITVEQVVEAALKTLNGEGNY
jgi:heptosyltransferase-2